MNNNNTTPKQFNDFCTAKNRICCHPEISSCAALHNSFQCTRPSGHKGRHVACGPDGWHNLNSWVNKENPNA
jgi:hypothetical protein